MSIYKIDTCTAGYGSNNIFTDFSLSISSGEFLSIIGPNGAGKTTLLRLLSGLLIPSKGQILLNEVDLQNLTYNIRAQSFSVVLQFQENIQPFYVYEYLQMGRFPFQRFWELETAGDSEIIDEVVELTGIQKYYKRSLDQLSGGELQLVSIARALVQNRDIILMDEPVSHLDLKHSIKIMDLLKKMHDAGSTIVTVLHDINMASIYTDRICALKDGNLFADGPPESVIIDNIIRPLFGVECNIITDNVHRKPVVIP